MPTALKLTVHQGDDVIAQETFERDVVKIGRLASAHLKLDDPKVSRIHAVIEATHDGVGYAIIDMGSTEGTVLNGRKISKERLSDGDELRLGDLRVMVNMALDAASLSSSEGSSGTSDAPPPPPPIIDLSSQDIDPASGRGGFSARATPKAKVGHDPAPPPADMPPVPEPSDDVVAPTSPPADAAAGASMATADGSVAATDGEGASLSSAGAEDAAPAPVGVEQPDQPVLASEADGASEGQDAGGDEVEIPPAHPAMSAHSAALASSAPVSVEANVPLQPIPAAVPPVGAQTFAGPASQAVPHTPALAYDPWGTVPNNLASESVPATDRMLEIRTVWGTNVLETLSIDGQSNVTLGDERQVVGWGPFQRIETCDIQVPSQGLPAKSFVLAEKEKAAGAHYRLNLPPGLDGYIQRADGTIIPLAHLYQGGEGAYSDYPGSVPGAVQYRLRAAETVFLVYGNVIFQIRYIRRNRLLAPPLWAEINYSWLNILLLAIFIHVMAIVSFLSTPNTTTELTEDIFRHPVRFAQFRLTPEQRQQRDRSLLSKLKNKGEAGRAKGKEGKAGKADAKTKKSGRMAAATNDPNKDKAAAQSALDRLLGNTPGKGARGLIMGTGRLGGELQAALGGVSGREVGDAAGLGGLGTRGVGKGGGDLSMDAVGLGSLGTRGRGGGLGGSGYGESAARLGTKKERDIEISAGNAIIQGSLDKELIRKVIKDHIAQIRYCYERELQASPGLAGKVATRWIINANGRVERPKVDQTSLKNTKVERCVLSKIRTWRFPKPKGGGIVIVKYPFIFKTSG